MYLGYNTNGLAHHDPLDAIALLDANGYRGVALTVDHGILAPDVADHDGQLWRIRRALERAGMRSVIETGARFLLDPRRKHEPTLVTADPAGRDRRLAFYQHCIRVAAQLGSDCVSIWSGVLRDDAPRAAAFERLVDGLVETLRYARRQGVVIAFEPEPGMLVDSLVAFEELTALVDGAAGDEADALRLTLDVGHLHCQGETPIADAIRVWGDRIANVHIEDMRSGVHEHLMFGEGEIEFPPVVRAFSDIDYAGGLYVELSRHSHQAPSAVRRSFSFLQPMIDAL